MRKKVLFLCIHNPARSRMAETFLKKLCPEDYEVYSAGIEPKGVNSCAIKVMAEIGIDISGIVQKVLRSLKI